MSCFKGEPMTLNSRPIQTTSRGVAGFSLIEIVVVVTLILILAAFALPNLAGYLRAASIRSAQQEVLGELQAARYKAISKNVRFGVVFVVVDRFSYRYVVEDDQTPPRDGARPAVSTLLSQPQQLGPLRRLPAGVEFATTCPGMAGPFGRAMRFSRLGGWCRPNGAMTTRCPAVDTGTDLIWNDPADVQGSVLCLVHPRARLTRRIFVAPGGRARVEG
jgi:prepilin-type N-terminal cleavage/methylation domain-containing protein